MKAILRSGFLALAIMLAQAGPVNAGLFERGMAAYQCGDYVVALKFLQPLAEQGDAFAQAFLGVMFFEGQGVPRDDAEAAKWYRLAAEQGNAVAQFAIGLMHREGWGVPQDYAEALKWHRKAAEQGNAWAQESLGHIYENGEGVPQDYVLAHMWFSLAAAQDDETAKHVRDMAAKTMTPDQIAEAERLAREWMAKHRQ